MGKFCTRIDRRFLVSRTPFLFLFLSFPQKTGTEFQVYFLTEYSDKMQQQMVTIIINVSLAGDCRFSTGKVKEVLRSTFKE